MHTRYFESLKRNNGKKCPICGKPITLMDGLRRKVHIGPCLRKWKVEKSHERLAKLSSGGKI